MQRGEQILLPRHETHTVAGSGRHRLHHDLALELHVSDVVGRDQATACGAQPDGISHQLRRPLVHADGSGAQARADHTHAGERAQRREGTILARGTVHRGKDHVGPREQRKGEGERLGGRAPVRAALDAPDPVTVDRHARDLVIAHPQGRGDRGCRCQRHLVLGVLSPPMTSTFVVMRHSSALAARFR